MGSRFKSFLNTVEQSRPISEDSFSDFKKRMKTALKVNAIHRRKAIQSASEVILMQLVN